MDVCLAALFAGLACLLVSAAAQAASCDRACLKGFVDDYLEALVAHDPGRLPLADDVKFTENGVELELGDAVWGTAESLGRYRNYFMDVEEGQVAFFGTIHEYRAPAILVLRLKVENGEKISEIETMVVRDVQGANTLDARTPAGLWTETIPQEERMSRAGLVRIANMYFSGLENNDGKGVYPFTDDCNRMENGTYTTNNDSARPPGVGGGAAPAERQPLSIGNIMAMGCKEQFETGYFRFDTRIRDRRFKVVDPERGVVFAFVFFDHNGTVRDYELADGSIAHSRVGVSSWMIGEAFKIENGLIRYVEANMFAPPYGMKPGWDD